MPLVLVTYCSKFIPVGLSVVCEGSVTGLKSKIALGVYVDDDW
jgi:hypothetical protein